MLLMYKYKVLLNHTNNRQLVLRQIVKFRVLDLARAQVVQSCSLFVVSKQELKSLQVHVAARLHTFFEYDRPAIGVIIVLTNLDQ